MSRRLAIALGGFVVVHAVGVQADHLPDCAEAFGESSLAVHTASNGNLNLRDSSRVFQTTGVNANASGGSSLNQQAGAVCIADDDPTDTSPGTCDTFGAVTSWEDSGRSFPEPPSDTYPNGPNLTVTNGQTVTIDFSGGSPDAYSRITIEDGGHLIIDDTAISGAGEVTVRNSFTGEPGAELTLNGTSIINVDGSFDFGGDKNSDPRSTITVNGVAGDTTDTFSTGSITLQKTDVDATTGTWRPNGGGKVDFVESDVNCDSTHAAGAQPANVMPECQDTDGGVFVISRSTGTIDTTEFRGFFYTDGTQFNINDSNIQGALTGGGMTVRTSDVVPGDIPTTGDFCEEKVAEFTFDLGVGNASTCARREIGVIARDRFGQQLDTYHNEVALSTSSNHGDWFKTDSDGNPGTNGADGTLADTGTTDDGAAEYEYVDSDDGSISLFLENIHADDLTVTVQDLGTEGTISTSGTLSFRDNVFVIESVDAHGSDIVAGRDHRFETTLWQRDDTTGDCEVPTDYNDPAQAVRMWVDRHADDPGGAGPTATGVETGDSASLGNTMPGSANIQLDFSGSGATTAGRARFDLSTTDVGKYALEMHEENSGFAVDVNGDPRPISGGSSDQVVRPFGFDVSVAGDDNTTGASGTVLAVAGDDVDTTVEAVVWQSADDTDDDGVPDSGADLSDNSATPNFGNEATPETVTISPTVAAPAGGSNGSLSAATFSSFTSGSETHGVSWSEVGHVHIDAAITDGSYLGGSDATGRADTVGRFIPADFNVTVADNGSLAAECAATFTYTGQANGYATGMEPELTITARNRSSATTTNYRGTYAKLVASDVSVSPPTEDASQQGADSLNNVTVTAAVNTGSRTVNGDGTVTYTFDSGDSFTYDKNANARIGGFTPNIDIDVTGVDDGEVAADPATLPTVEPVATHEIRFGRLAIDAASGSELAPIDQPVRAEYWDTGTWQTHTADDCTSFNLTDGVDLRNPDTLSNAWQTGDTTMNVGGGTSDASLPTDPVTLAAGSTTITFSAPGENNTGFIDVRLPLDEAAVGLDYLRDDWDDDDGAGDGPFDDYPAARATFGIFSGNPNWIHFRRVQ